jgi:hypothetical protein
MPKKPREWGNNAANARDRSAEELIRILREARRLRDIVKRGTYTREELALIAAEQIDAAQTALRHLENQGAQTRPE